MDQVHPFLLLLAAIAERLWAVLKMAATTGAITAGVSFFLWLLSAFLAPIHL